jgi:lipid II:glycine glycyltransferase (peptidoglycan interpeptide bridge formation enzyme)
MRLRPAEPSDASAWQELLEHSDSGDFLHDWEWSAVAAHDGEPQYRFVLQEANGGLTALVAAQERPLGLGRRFWYVPHGPVMDYGDAGAEARLAAIITGLRAAAEGRRSIAVRFEPRLAMGSAAAATFNNAGLRKVDGHLQVSHTRIVPMAGDEQMLSAMDKDTRYSVRRAGREGVSISETNDGRDDGPIQAVYELSRLTQQRAGFPLRPFQRFQLAWRGLAGARRAWIMHAHHEDRLLAGAMMIHEGGQSFYFLAGSVREQPGERKLFASHALQWALMRRARDEGARRHDLWGIAPPEAGADHPWAGVGLFKKGFGGEAVAWAGMWDLVVDPLAYRLRAAAGPLLGLGRRIGRRR